MSETKTYFGLNERNIRAMGEVADGLEQLERSVDFNRFGIGPITLSRPATLLRYGQSSLQLMPLIDQAVNKGLAGETLSASEIRPYAKSLMTFAETSLLNNDLEGLRNRIIGNSTSSVEELKKYQALMRDALSDIGSARFIANGAGFIAPNALWALMGWLGPATSFEAGIGLFTANVLASGLVRSVIDSYVIEPKVAHQIAKMAGEIPNLATQLPESFDLTNYRDYIESLIPSENPASDMQLDFKNMLDAIKRNARDAFRGKRSDPERFAKELLRETINEYQAFRQNSRKYPFFSSSLNLASHLSPQQINLPDMEIQDRMLDDAIILAPEVYQTLAILAGDYHSDHYDVLVKAGGMRRSLATGLFEGQARDKSGIEPGRLGEALSTLASGVSNLLPESRKTVLEDYDSLTLRINRLRSKRN